MNRLLLLSCSRSKRADSGLLPAYERYDGPAYRLLRRYLNFSTSFPAIKILSAEFGLIAHDLHIPNYDRPMTTQRALELRPQVREELKGISETGGLKGNQQIFIYSGKSYLTALEGDNVFPSKAAVKVATGPPGKRLADLYKWLYGDSGVRRQASPVSPRGSARVRGVDIKLTTGEVFDAARRAMAEGSFELDYRSWFVSVDGQRVPVKWLVSVLTGLSLSSFHTDEARRALSQLGIRIQTV